MSEVRLYDLDNCQPGNYLSFLATTPEYYFLNGCRQVLFHQNSKMFCAFGDRADAVGCFRKNNQEQWVFDNAFSKYDNGTLLKAPRSASLTSEGLYILLLSGLIVYFPQEGDMTYSINSIQDTDAPGLSGQSSMINMAQCETAPENDCSGFYYPDEMMAYNNNTLLVVDNKGIHFIEIHNKTARYLQTLPVQLPESAIYNHRVNILLSYDGMIVFNHMNDSLTVYNAVSVTESRSSTLSSQILFILTFLCISLMEF